MRTIVARKKINSKPDRLPPDRVIAASRRSVRSLTKSDRPVGLVNRTAIDSNRSIKTSDDGRKRRDTRRLFVSNARNGREPWRTSMQDELKREARNVIDRIVHLRDSL
jgi:hypothetical protein